MCIQHLIAYLWSTLTDQFQNKSHSACSFVVSARAYQPWYSILLSHQINTNRVYQPRNQPANRLIVSSRLKYCTIVYLGPLQPLRGIHQLKFTTGWSFFQMACEAHSCTSVHTSANYCCLQYLCWCSVFLSIFLHIWTDCNIKEKINIINMYWTARP